MRGKLKKSKDSDSSAASSPPGNAHPSQVGWRQIIASVQLSESKHVNTGRQKKNPPASDRLRKLGFKPTFEVLGHPMSNGFE